MIYLEKAILCGSGPASLSAIASAILSLGRFNKNLCILFRLLSSSSSSLSSSLLPDLGCPDGPETAGGKPGMLLSSSLSSSSSTLPLAKLNFFNLSKPIFKVSNAWGFF